MLCCAQCYGSEGCEDKPDGRRRQRRCRLRCCCPRLTRACSYSRDSQLILYTMITTLLLLGGASATAARGLPRRRAHSDLGAAAARCLRVPSAERRGDGRRAPAGLSTLYFILYTCRRAPAGALLIIVAVGIGRTDSHSAAGPAAALAYKYTYDCTACRT